MSPQLKKRKLNEIAMLSHLRINSWSGRKLDKSQTQKVLTLESAAGDAGAWWTALCPASELQKIRYAGVKVRNVHTQWTLPWQDGGMRILSSGMYSTYSEKMRKVIEEHEEVIDEFMKYYPSMVAAAPERLKGLMNDYVFPSKSEMKAKFKVKVTIHAIPEADDFRVDLDADEVEDIKKGIEQSINEMTEVAMTSVWTNLSDLIHKIKSTMGNSSKKFHASLFGNLKEFAELIPKMNLTNDQRLEKVRQDVLKTLALTDAEVVKEDTPKRKATEKKAKDLLNKMSDYGYKPSPQQIEKAKKDAKKTAATN